MNKRKLAGFTLIEVMIVVAVIGILAAVALPSYQDYIRRGKRADAQALLQNAAFAQERHRLNNATYASATTALTGVCPSSGTCLSPQGNYSLSISPEFDTSDAYRGSSDLTGLYKSSTCTR